MKTIEEQIEVIKHFGNGGEVEIFTNGEWNLVVNRDFANWNFGLYDFRIKEQKKTVTIEKWLMEASDKKSNFIMECDDSYFENYYTSNKKVKLLDTYEIEL